MQQTSEPSKHVLLCMSGLMELLGTMRVTFSNNGAKLSDPTKKKKLTK